MQIAGLGLGCLFGSTVFLAKETCIRFAPTNCMIFYYAHQLFKVSNATKMYDPKDDINFRKSIGLLSHPTVLPHVSKACSPSHTKCWGIEHEPRSIAKQLNNSYSSNLIGEANCCFKTPILIQFDPSIIITCAVKYLESKQTQKRRRELV